MRLRTFMNALRQLHAKVDVLYFAPAHEILQLPKDEALRHQQSVYWGLELQSAHVAPMAAAVPRTSYSHYIRPIISIFNHPFFQSFSGRLQVDAVRRRLADQPDLIVVERLAGMLPLFKAGPRHPPILFDMTDIEHKVRLRAATAERLRPGTLATIIQSLPIFLAERKAASWAKATLVCSTADQRYLTGLGMPRVQVVPNSVRIPASLAPLSPDPTLLFLGNFNHEPNRAAVKWLVDAIWPRIAARMPQARLLIAGGPVEMVSGLRTDPANTEILGFVPDLDALYARARVVCCPILSGGGTRVKLIEAGAYAKPMVSTRIGAEGLDIADEVELLLRDDAEAFAEACVQLLQNDARCERLGIAARTKMASLYEASQVEQRIIALMQASHSVKT